MRVAAISDVHGNSIALDAVLADAGDVDGWWVLGDLVALGPDPVGVLERLDALENVEAIRGNTDRYTATGDFGGPGLDSVVGDRDLVVRFGRSAASFGWTRGVITAAGWFDHVASLPLELRRALPDGTHVLGVHAS